MAPFGFASAFFQDASIAHPSLCGYPGLPDKQLSHHVHADLGKKFSFVEEDHLVEHRQVKYLKVSTPQYPLANFE
jgi:hypothetical protein